MMLGLRLGDRPRVLIATTPRTTPFMKKLVAMDDVRITTGSTYDNAAHLSADFLKLIGLRQRRPSLVVAVALANKTARIAWAVMHRHENYQRVAAAA